MIRIRRIPTYKILLVILALLLFAAIFLSGCSSSRKLDKQRNRSEQKVQQSTDVRTKVDDKTVTTVRESVDTTVTTPGFKVQSESVGNKTVVDTPDGTLSSEYDKVTNVIKSSFTAKPRPVTVHKVRSTTVQADVQTDTRVETDSSGVTKTDTLTKHVDSKTKW